MSGHELKPLCFMSYAHADNADGELTAFAHRLALEVRKITGRDFPIFHDREHVYWGQQWRDRLSSALGDVTFLLPILTPSFFNSEFCRGELGEFLQRERARGRADLVLPVYYISTPFLEDPGRRSADPLAAEMAERQYTDWRELRLESLDSREARRAMARLAEQVSHALHRARAEPPPAADGRSSAEPDPDARGAEPGPGAPLEPRTAARPGGGDLPSPRVSDREGEAARSARSAPPAQPEIRAPWPSRQHRVRSTMNPLLTARDVDDAQYVIRSNSSIVETPTVYSAALSHLIEEERGIRTDVFLKLENLQTTRSYKIRGAYNKIDRLVSLYNRNGIKRLVTASAGNHAQGVAFAAAEFGLADKTAIYVPESTPIPKIVGIQRYGVQPIRKGRDYDAASQIAHADAEADDECHYIEAYNDLEVMAGQGTVGYEMLEALRKNPRFNYRRSRTIVLCPIGGGGLLSGLGTYVRAHEPEFLLVGVEPVGSAKTRQSLHTGQRFERADVSTMADGVKVRQLGTETFSVIRSLLRSDDVQNVGEERILRAVRMLIGIGMAVEGAGALALAALLHAPPPREGVPSVYERGETPPLELKRGDKVVLVVSGANVSAGVLLKQIQALADDEDRMESRG